MGDLTKNFSRGEFACKCGCGFDKIDEHLVHLCQVIRDEMGVPIRVNSACRCASRNKAAGGVPNSYHTQGKAVDLSWNGKAINLFNVIKYLYAQGKLPKLEYCRLYKTQNFVHIDIGKKRNARFAEG